MTTPIGMVNPLHWRASDPDVLWSPGNVSEAIPGVSSALNWTFIDDAIETAARRAFHAMGILGRDELALGRTAEERYMVCFFGRTVANIEAMRGIGDRTPGTSANAVEQQLFGVVRPDAVNRPTYSRVAAVATRAPVVIARVGSRQRHLRAEVVALWRDVVVRPPRDLDSARTLLSRARGLYAQSFELATLASMFSQALYDRLVLMAGGLGLPGLEHRLVTGYQDLLETNLVVDLWRLAHNEIDLSSFLLRHGYHGPAEGQMDSLVWRERTLPLLALVDRYAGRGADAHPSVAERRQAMVRRDAEAELLAAAGRLRAPGARATLRLGRHLIPQREVGKANYTQCLDIARIAARAIGGQLVTQGLLQDPEDVFGLTYDEVMADRLPPDLPALAAERRALRDDYLTSDLPAKWTGRPQRVPIDTAPVADAPEQQVVVGEPVGGGSVTGRVRVVTDPAVDDLEPGEILVCRMTDPGWASLFHLAGGIAVDMGGQMSHGAIVARELGLPCVTCTVDGTRRLRTGDLVHLDGDAGRIEVIDREELSA